MASSNFLSSLLLLLQALITLLSAASAADSNLFTEYIGANFKGVRFSDVPINPGVDFHFILSFAIDYTTTSNSHTPTDGQFNIFWDTVNLSPSQVAAIKQRHGNVKVALSLGGATVGGKPVYFQPSSIDSWVDNAVDSLTSIIKQYHLDGIDIDYEQFHADSDSFTECIGQLLMRLKNNGVISFASIAPFADAEVQSHYLALWRKYGHLIDYVNFQFYAYDANTTVSQFLSYFAEQSSNYNGGKVLASIITGASGGLSPQNGFFRACNILKKQGKLYGIFIWCADNSKSNGFRYEKQAQNLLASAR
ncbi:chitinase 2-like [Cocos nucifera]|uniref:Chitinase 2-like n=1 Tax=Cocos nucifera TaxID=13894 RepID=A0A8K0IXK0_COCNU|nr:chitinase 2-like [Cocos nucifera]